MAKPKWNVSTPRKYGEDKTFWVNIGSAWENDGNGKHFATISLDALPLPDAEGKVRIFLFPKDDDERNTRRGGPDRAYGETRTERSGGGRKPKVKHNDDDDEIPF